MCCRPGANAQADLFQCIEVIRNQSRCHPTLRYDSPARLLESWISQHAVQQSVAAEERPDGRRSSMDTLVVSGTRPDERLGSSLLPRVTSRIDSTCRRQSDDSRPRGPSGASALH